MATVTIRIEGQADPSQVDKFRESVEKLVAQVEKANTAHEGASSGVGRFFDAIGRAGQAVVSFVSGIAKLITAIVAIGAAVVGVLSVMAQLNAGLNEAGPAIGRFAYGFDFLSKAVDGVHPRLSSFFESLRNGLAHLAGFSNAQANAQAGAEGMSGGLDKAQLALGAFGNAAKAMASGANSAQTAVAAIAGAAMVAAPQFAPFIGIAQQLASVFLASKPEIEDTGQAIEKMGGQVVNAIPGLGQLFTSLVKLNIIGQLADNVKRFGQEMMTAASSFVKDNAEMERFSKLTEIALQNRNKLSGPAATSAARAWQDQARQLTAGTTSTDEEAMGLFQKLSQTGLTGSVLRRLTQYRKGGPMSESDVIRTLLNVQNAFPGQDAEGLIQSISRGASGGSMSRPVMQLSMSGVINKNELAKAGLMKPDADTAKLTSAMFEQMEKNSQGAAEKMGKLFDGIVARMKKGMGELKEAFAQPVMEGLERAIERFDTTSFIDKVQGIANALGENLGKVIEAAGSYIAWFSDKLSGINTGPASDMINALIDVGNTLIEWFTDVDARIADLNAAWRAMAEFLQPLVDLWEKYGPVIAEVAFRLLAAWAAVELAKAGMSTLGGVLQTVWSDVTGVAGSVITLAIQFGGLVVALGLVAVAMQIMGVDLNDVQSFLQGLIPQVDGTTAAIGNATAGFDTASTAVENARACLLNLSSDTETVTQAIGTVGDVTVSMAGDTVGATEAIGNAFVGMFDSAAATFGTGGQAIVESYGNVAAAVVSTTSTAATTTASVWDKMIAKIKEIINDMSPWLTAAGTILSRPQESMIAMVTHWAKNSVKNSTSEILGAMGLPSIESITGGIQSYTAAISAAWSKYSGQLRDRAKNKAQWGWLQDSSIFSGGGAGFNPLKDSGLFGKGGPDVGDSGLDIEKPEGAGKAKKEKKQKDAKDDQKAQEQLAQAMANTAVAVANAIDKGLAALNNLAGAKVPERSKWESKLNALKDFLGAATDMTQQIAFGVMNKAKASGYGRGKVGKTKEGADIYDSSPLTQVSETADFLLKMVDTVGATVKLLTDIRTTKLPSKEKITSVLSEVFDLLEKIEEEAFKLSIKFIADREARVKKMMDEAAKLKTPASGETDPGQASGQALGQILAGEKTSLLDTVTSVAAMMKSWVDVYASAINVMVTAGEKYREIARSGGSLGKIEPFLTEAGAVLWRIVTAMKTAIPEVDDQNEAMSRSLKVAEVVKAAVSMFDGIGDVMTSVQEGVRTKADPRGVQGFLQGTLDVLMSITDAMTKKFPDETDLADALGRISSTAALMSSVVAPFKDIGQVMSSVQDAAQLGGVNVQPAAQFMKSAVDLIWSWMGAFSKKVTDDLDRLDLYDEAAKVSTALTAIMGVFKSAGDAMSSLSGVPSVSPGAVSKVKQFMLDMASMVWSFMTAFAKGTPDLKDRSEILDLSIKTSAALKAVADLAASAAVAMTALGTVRSLDPAKLTEVEAFLRAAAGMVWRMMSDSSLTANPKRTATDLGVANALTQTLTGVVQMIAQVAAFSDTFRQVRVPDSGMIQTVINTAMTIARLFGNAARDWKAFISSRPDPEGRGTKVDEELLLIKAFVESVAGPAGLIASLSQLQLTRLPNFDPSIIPELIARGRMMLEMVWSEAQKWEAELAKLDEARTLPGRMDPGAALALLKAFIESVLGSVSMVAQISGLRLVDLPRFDPSLLPEIVSRARAILESVWSAAKAWDDLLRSMNDMTGPARDLLGRYDITRDTALAQIKAFVDSVIASVGALSTIAQIRLVDLPNFDQNLIAVLVARGVEMLQEVYLAAQSWRREVERIRGSMDDPTGFDKAGAEAALIKAFVESVTAAISLVGAAMSVRLDYLPVFRPELLDQIMGRAKLMFDAVKAAALRWRLMIEAMNDLGGLHAGDRDSPETQADLIGKWVSAVGASVEMISKVASFTLDDITVFKPELVQKLVERGVVMLKSVQEAARVWSREIVLTRTDVERGLRLGTATGETSAFASVVGQVVDMVSGLSELRLDVLPEFNVSLVDTVIDRGIMILKRVQAAAERWVKAQDQITPDGMGMIGGGPIQDPNVPPGTGAGRASGAIGVFVSVIGAAVDLVKGLTDLNVGGMPEVNLDVVDRLLSFSTDVLQRVRVYALAWSSELTGAGMSPETMAKELQSYIGSVSAAAGLMGDLMDMVGRLGTPLKKGQIKSTNANLPSLGEFMTSLLKMVAGEYDRLGDSSSKDENGLTEVDRLMQKVTIMTEKVGPVLSVVNAAVGAVNDLFASPFFNMHLASRLKGFRNVGGANPQAIANLVKTEVETLMNTLIDALTSVNIHEIPPDFGNGMSRIAAAYQTLASTLQAVQSVVGETSKDRKTIVELAAFGQELVTAAAGISASGAAVSAMDDVAKIASQVVAIGRILSEAVSPNLSTIRSLIAAIRELYGATQGGGIMEGGGPPMPTTPPRGRRNAPGGSGEAPGGQGGSGGTTQNFYGNTTFKIQQDGNTASFGYFR